MADDVEALRQYLGLGKVNVMGNSFGGFWALTYALRHQDAINKLILITTSPSYAFYEAEKVEAARKGTPEQIAAVPDVFEGKITSDDDFTKWWDIVAPLYYHRWDENLREGFKRGTSNAECASYMFRDVIPSYDVRSRLAEITVPTLVLGGRHDWVTPVGNPKPSPPAFPAASWSSSRRADISPSSRNKIVSWTSFAVSWDSPMPEPKRNHRMIARHQSLEESERGRGRTNRDACAEVMYSP
jgi:proline iminopeptidase